MLKLAITAFLAAHAVSAFHYGYQFKLPAKTEGYDNISAKFYVDPASNWTKGYYAATMAYYTMEGNSNPDWWGSTLVSSLWGLDSP